jgi:outer membrane protein assembly factor BamB
MNRIFCLLGLAGLLLLAGCRKDDVVDCAPATAPNALDDFVRRNGAPVQTFALNLGNIGTFPQVVVTSGGAGIQLPANGFLLPNGSAATGTAQARIREIYSVADMLLSNMPTTQGGSRKLLISGGEFSIQVWQNGVRLRLAPGARVVVRSPVPAGAASGQQLLWQQPDTRLLGDSAGWVPPTPLPPSSFPSASDTIRITNTPPVYQTPIPLDSVSWWNIDQLWALYRNTPVGNVTVQVPANTGSTQVFLRTVGLNGLARLYPSNAARTSWSASMPTGANMKVAVLQSINGQLYFGTQSITTQSGLVVTPTLTAMSEADVVRLIRQF